MKHGAAPSKNKKLIWPEYRVWCNIVQRCENPKTRNYKDYGGRGIIVAPEFHDFSAFIAHVGRRPDQNLSIDRIDNDNGYVPNNLRWATRKQQAHNRRPR